MSNTLDWNAERGLDPSALLTYALLRLEVVDAELLAEAAEEAGIRNIYSDCDCELEAVPCACERHSLGWFAEALLKPECCQWSDEAISREGRIEICYAVQVPACERLNEIDSSDRDHWRALLCASVFQAHFDRPASFYEEVGLALVAFDVSDRLHELNCFYA